MRMPKPLDIRDEKAIDLLKKKGIVVVRKSTSAGLTTSVIRNVKKLGLKLAVLEPTLKILDDQTKKALKEGIKINYFRRNKDMCEKVKMLCEAQPWRNEILRCQYIPKECKQCRKKEEVKCLYKELLNQEHDVIGLTYSKSDFMNRDIIDKIKLCDVFLLDEITTALKSDIKPIMLKENNTNYFTNSFLEKLGNYRFKKEYYIKDETELFDLMWSELFYLVGVIDYQLKEIIKHPLKLDGFGAEKIVGVISLNEKLLSENRAQILNRENNRILLETYARLHDFPTAKLNGLLELYSEDYLLVEKEGITISIRPISVNHDVFAKILEFFDPNKQLLIISDASTPPMLKLLLNEHKIKDYYWGDPLKTNQTQFIITDTITWASKKQFFHMTEAKKDSLGKDIARTSKAISRNKLKSYLITPESTSHVKGKRYNYANIAQIDWHEKGILDDKIIIDDYHRRTNARGIKFGDKAILEYHLSRPLIPRNSYTPLCFITQESKLYPILSSSKPHLIKFNA